MKYWMLITAESLDTTGRVRAVLHVAEHIERSAYDDAVEDWYGPYRLARRLPIYEHVRLWMDEQHDMDRHCRTYCAVRACGDCELPYRSDDPLDPSDVGGAL